MKLFIDTETTGLPKRRNAPYSDVENWPRLVQLAWTLVDPAGREVAAAEYIVQPVGFTIPKDAARIHGITTEIAREKGIPAELALAEFTKAVSVAETIIAHNVDYDRPVLEAEYVRQGSGCDIGDRQLVCTMQLSTDYCAIPSRYGYKWPSLNELHEKLFNSAMTEAHNALVDVRACMKCYFELERRGILGSGRSGVAEEVQVSSEEDGECAQELIDEVHELAEEHDWFDSEFVDSVAEQYEEKGSLT